MHTTTDRAMLYLSTRSILLWLAMPAAVAVLLQFLLGASPLVVLIVTMIVVFGLASFRLGGAYNAGAWLALYYVLGNVLVALYTKTLLGQSLDSYLFVPEQSFFVLLTTTLALVLAMTIVYYLPIGRPILNPVMSWQSLNWLSWGCFFLGVAFWVLNVRAQSADGSGFGGFSALRNFLLMGVIARTALLLQISSDRRAFDWTLLIFIGVGVFLGLLSNSKTQAAYPVVSYYATLLFFRGGLPTRQLVVLALGLTLFVYVLSPMIHAWRYMGIQEMSVGERLSMIQSDLGAVFQGGQLDQMRAEADRAFLGGHYDYFGPGGQGQMLLGRYASVQQIDPVIMMAQTHGTMGGEVIWPSFLNHIPSIIYRNKSEFIEGYEILTHLRLIDPRGGKFPTVPLAGQAYAGFGMVGVVLVSFFTFLVFLLVYKKLGWNLHRNVFAIFFFCQFIIVYAGQGTLGQYAGAMLRYFPLSGAVFWMLCFIPEQLLRHRRELLD